MRKSQKREAKVLDWADLLDKAEAVANHNVDLTAASKRNQDKQVWAFNSSLTPDEMFPVKPGDRKFSTVDPAKIVARIMALDALSAAGLLWKVKRDGIRLAIIFQADPAWIVGQAFLGIKDAFREVVVGDDVEPQFLAFLGDGEGSPILKNVRWRARSDSGRDDEDVREALNTGRGVFGLTADMNLLPPKLLEVADAVLPLGKPSENALKAAFVHVVGDWPDREIPDSLLEVLTPGMLGDARRPGQTPDDYLDRLLALAAKELEKATQEKAALTARLNALDNLHGAPEAVAWGKALETDIAGFIEGKLPWADVDRGALIYGPPGCGKTTFAVKLAAACGKPLLATSYGAWQAEGKGYLGDVCKAIQETFEKARTMAAEHGAVIVAIDEIDSIPARGRTKAEHDDWWTALTNTLLAELDGCQSRDGVVVLGMTNFPERIDPALVRPGRLDRLVKIGLPSPDELAAILGQHLGDAGVGLDLLSVTKGVRGASGALAEQWARGARRRARQAGRDVTLADLAAEIDGEKVVLPAEFVRRLAVHEAGHAVIMEHVRPGSVQGASIRVGSSGVVSRNSVGQTLSVDDIEGLVSELLAGRAAEQVILGSVSVTSGGDYTSDLAQATSLSAAIDTGYGGSGLLWLAGTEEAMSLVRLRPDVAARTEERLNRIYEATIAQVGRLSRVIEAVADKLTECETLTGDDVRAAIQEATDGMNLMPTVTHAGTGTRQ